VIRSASSRFVSTQPVRAVRSPSHLGPTGIRPKDALRVGHHRHDLLPDHIFLRKDVDGVAE
jgi:hypothetical protein